MSGLGPLQQAIGELHTQVENSVQQASAFIEHAPALPPVESSLSDLVGAFTPDCSTGDQFHFPEAIQDLRAALQDLIDEPPLPIDSSIVSWVHQLLDSHITRDEWFANNMVQDAEAVRDLHHSWLVT